LPIHDHQDHLFIATQSSFSNQTSQYDNAALPDQTTNLIRLYKLLKNTCPSFARTPKQSRRLLGCPIKHYWWRMTGSNRRPPACKAGALPAELIPQRMEMVGLVGFEPTTPALSRRCSNQLSYRPLSITQPKQSAAQSRKQTSTL
jgi:hypothetical protein